MSMLTVQVERLRNRAKELRQGRWSDGVYDAQLMDDAADIIENLRNRLTERETCHDVAPDYLDFLCDSCGFVHYHSDENDDGDGNGWLYCPNCGRRCVG